jgi:Gpi18-like mannosyltransferase
MDFKLDPGLKKILLIFIGLKIALTVTGMLAQAYIPADLTWRQQISDNQVLSPWAQYDSLVYLDVAKNGYSADYAGSGNYGWFPLFPLLIRIFSVIGYDLSAFLVANVASFIAVIVLYYLVREELDESRARKACFYLLLFPTAFYLTAMYTESLFIMLAISSFYFARKEKWLFSGICGALAAVTRMQGVFIFLPVFYIYLRKKGFDIRKIKPDFAFIWLIPLSLGIFFSYLYFLTGDFFVQFRVQENFGRTITYPWVGFLNVLNSFMTSPVLAKLYYIFNIFMIVFFVALLYVSWKKLKPEYTIYFGISMAIPLLSATIQSITRFELVMFPAFMAMVMLPEKEQKLLGLLYAIFVALLFFFMVWHASGGFKIQGFN